MLSLVLDTTARVTCVGVHDGSEWLARKAETPERGHGDILATTVAKAIAEAKVEIFALSRIVLGSGPGSFTGIRVGLAFVRGLAFPRAIGICAVNTFERERARRVLRRVPTDVPVVVACFAKRNTVYLEEPSGISIASFEDAREILAPRLTAGEIQLVGEGAEMLFPRTDGITSPLSSDAFARENLDALIEAARTKALLPSREVDAFYVGEAEISKPKPRSLMTPRR